MFQDKVRQAISDTFKLLWSFKWYVGLYLLYYIINIISLFDIPVADDKIFQAEATSRIWSYTNQEVYIGSLRLEIIILSLLFLLGTSNMRNHPLLAKFFSSAMDLCNSSFYKTFLKVSGFAFGI